MGEKQSFIVIISGQGIVLCPLLFTILESLYSGRALLSSGRAHALLIRQKVAFCRDYAE